MLLPSSGFLTSHARRVAPRHLSTSLRGSSRSLISRTSPIRSEDDSATLFPSVDLRSTFRHKQVEPSAASNNPQPVVRRRGQVEDANNPNELYIAGLFSSNNYDWVEIFDFTMHLLQEKNNGFYDDIFGNYPDTVLKWAVADAGCDEATALQKYWDLRTNWAGPGILHGVVGCRCSGATIGTAYIARLESVSLVSPSATSEKLSDKADFPLVSRLVAPTMIEAVIATLRRFGWDRVSVIGTGTRFATDLEAEFSRQWLGGHNDKSGEWYGDISYTYSVSLDSDGNVEEESVNQALSGVPTDDPANNSRVILLVAHDVDAYRILQTAQKIGFQKDTIWIGLPSWIGRPPPDTAWISPHPGFIGITPSLNQDLSQDFLERLQADQISNGRPVLDALPDYTAEFMVDSIVALVMALVSISPEERHDGALVSSWLRGRKFEGIGGTVSFTDEGDREDPQYSIMSYQANSEGNHEWVVIGETGDTIGSADLDEEKICYPVFGCNLKSIPSDKPPVPPPPTQTWVAVVVSVLAILLLLALAVFAYWTLRKKEKLKRMARQLEQQMQGMREVTFDLEVPSPDAYYEKAKASSSNVNVKWSWREDAHRIDDHDASTVLSDTTFVPYSQGVSDQLEDAFQLWNENKGFACFRVDLEGKVASSLTGNKVAGEHTGHLYEVNFESFQQENLRSGYVREVRREEVARPIEPDAIVLPPLPKDIKFSGDKAEDLLPVRKGQLIQVSKEADSGEWLFGTVLFDPLLEEAVKQSHSGSAGGLGAVLANALHDKPTSGWFPRVVSGHADVKAMTKLLENLGDEIAAVLKSPDDWTEGHEGRHDVPRGSRKYCEVVDFFLAALYDQRRKVKVTKVERVQNVALWQSYALKKQAMVTRDAQNPDHLVHSKGDAEHKWLFHGTSSEVASKIEKQGFNRSFAGQNAVRFGKGVYFARDASYSCHARYSKKDDKGVQRMFMCRVAVGDYCKGTDGQLAPDSKPHNSLELFDSTVDNPGNPSIFVCYHDAQAYPEYLISFVRS